MSKDKERVSVGGQALIEGILMRGPECSAMALRMPDGSIEVEKKDIVPLTKKHKILSKPIIRGIAGYIDSMITGYNCLMESAEKTSFEDIKNVDEGEELSKVDKWITDHFGPKMVTAITIISAVLGVILSLFLFMWVPATIFSLINKATNEAIANFRGLFEGVMRMAIFIGYMLIVSRMKDIKRMFMYHGAEHKSIFCYENGLELTVENVRKQSRFHPRCGTSFLFVMIIISVIISSIVSIVFPVLTKITLVWVAVKILVILPIVMGLGYEFIKYAGSHDNKCVKILSAPGLWMQRITTNEPTDDIIEVGIVSLNAALFGVEYAKEQLGNTVEDSEMVEADENSDDIDLNVNDIPEDITFDFQDEIISESDENIEVEAADEEVSDESSVEEVSDSEDVETVEAENEVVAEAEIADAEEKTTEDKSDINKSVDEMMAELFEKTSFNDK